MQSAKAPSKSEPLALVRDDDPAVSTLVRQLLAACGYQAKTFETPLPLLTKIRVATPAPKVLDLAPGDSDAAEITLCRAKLEASANHAAWRRFHRFRSRSNWLTSKREAAADLSALIDVGCDPDQGSQLAKPIPAIARIDWLTSKQSSANAAVAHPPDHPG